MGGFVLGGEGRGRGTFGVVTAGTVTLWPRMGVAGVKSVVSSGTGPGLVVVVVIINDRCGP